MKMIKIPVRNTSSQTRIERIRTDARELLNEFCVRKVREEKLSTNSFTYSFDFKGNGTSSLQRKSVQRLFELLYKSVKKQVPFIEYMKGGEMFNTVFITENRAIIKIRSPYVMVDVSSISTDRAAFNTSHWWKVFNRYVKLLNRESLKYGSPLDCTYSNTVEVHKDDEKILKEHKDSNSTGYIPIRFCTLVTLKINVGQYVNSGYEECIADPENAEIQTVDQYRTRMKEKFPDWDLYSSGDWSLVPFRSFPTFVRGYEKYACPEKLFTMLGPLQRILKTFSKISAYDTPAFTIGGEPTA